MTSRDDLWTEWNRAYEQFGPDQVAHLVQLGEIAEEITCTTALKAITRLLGLIPETSGSERAELFDAADQIRKIAGLDWGDVIGRRGTEILWAAYAVTDARS